ncbi:hypothetical protein [Sphingobium phenoxybenzoativorans]|uniref:hypothetical protein n=1 Tax=Sphingobium phenoxybenzoativorans TaxID=1592790 RepID=UPI001FE688FF|nr:hypothetical protein [Sphingobium phenoxybenzoativorans]
MTQLPRLRIIHKNAYAAACWMKTQWPAGWPYPEWLNQQAREKFRPLMHADLERMKKVEAAMAGPVQGILF